MRIRPFHGVWLMVFMGLMLAISGCESTVALSKKVLPASLAKVLPGQPVLKKRVMVLPFVDQANVGAERADTLSRKFYDTLKEAPGLVLTEPPDGIFSSMGMRSPQYGIVTSSRLIDYAERQGMNAVVVGVLNPVEIATRKTGIWPFDKWRKYYTVSVSVNVINTVSKTLFLTHMESDDFSVPLDEAEQMDPEAFIADCLREALPELVEDQVPVVETALDEYPWTGRILAVENGTIMINGGDDIGVKTGQRFEVFSMGRTITAGSGRKVHLLREAEGEIETTQVMEAHALADAVAGGPFVPKQLVRVKR